jgi:hypothetical protein
MHGQIAVTLNRKGRKRKSGRRQPNGHRPFRAPDYRAMAANNPDRRGLPEALRLDERAGTVLGRLNLIYRIHGARKANAGHVDKPGISDQQYEAGLTYSRIYGAYMAQAGAPHGLSGSGAAIGCNPEECMKRAADEPLRFTCACEEKTHRYMRAYEAIGKGRSPHEAHKAHMAINWTAIQDNLPSEDQMMPLREGLSALARHFGLTGKGMAG